MKSEKPLSMAERENFSASPNTVLTAHTWYMAFKAFCNWSIQCCLYKAYEDSEGCYLPHGHSSASRTPFTFPLFPLTSLSIHLYSFHSTTQTSVDGCTGVPLESLVTFDVTVTLTSCNTFRNRTTPKL